MKNSSEVEFSSNHIYCLRVCNADLTSHHGFQWSGVGSTVTAPDFDPTPECGRGLHGWLNGIGDSSCAIINPDSKWLVVSVSVQEPIIDLGGKVKFRSCRVEFAGGQKEAVEFLESKVPGLREAPVIGAFRRGGDHCRLVGGDRSVLTGGYRSTVTGGDDSTVTGGYNSTVTGGYDSTVTGGNYSTVTGGNYSTVTGGNYSTVTGGEGSALVISYFKWDGNRNREVRVVGYVGEDGIEAGVKYREESGKLVKV